MDLGRADVCGVSGFAEVGFLVYLTQPWQVINFKKNDYEIFVGSRFFWPVRIVSILVIVALASVYKSNSSMMNSELRVFFLPHIPVLFDSLWLRFSGPSYRCSRTVQISPLYLVCIQSSLHYSNPHHRSIIVTSIKISITHSQRFINFTLLHNAKHKNDKKFWQHIENVKQLV